MAENDYTQISMILAIISAILIIVGAFLVILAATAVRIYAHPTGVPQTDVAYELMVEEGLGAMMIVMGVIGIISGAMVLIGGILIKNPQKRVVGSVLVLVFAIVSIFGGGGLFFIGTILGVIAGILGLISKPA